MELEKKSDLQSLIPAVLVGLLALAANEYTKMDPAALRESVESMEKQVTTLLKEKKKPKPKKTDLDVLKELQNSTSERYESWRATRQVVKRQKIQSTIEEADRLTANVIDDPEAQPKDKSRARMLRVSIYFMAAEWAPTEYSRPFIEMADVVIETEAPEISDNIAVLRFYHLTEFGVPDDSALLGDLRTFGEHHSRESSIELYSMIAAELWRRGYRQLSADVLNQGIRLLSGSVGVSHLVNQLIDQQRL